MENNTEELKKELNQLILDKYKINSLKESDNKFFLLNIFINKPVYKKNENIKVHWFAYNKLTKKPILKNFINNFKLEIKDSSNYVRISKEIKYNSITDNNYDIINNLNPGFYKISINNMNSSSFLIQDNSEKIMTISINWNKEFINTNDTVIGNISVNLKSLENIKNRLYTYNIYDNKGLLLYSQKNINLDKNSFIKFNTTSYKLDNIIIKIDFDFDGLKQTYSKVFYQFKENLYNINYFFESINPISDEKNKAFLKITSINENNDIIPINTKFEIWENNKFIYEGKTILDGRGEFFINKFNKNKEYYIRINNFIQLIKFVKIDNYLKLNKKIFNYGDILNFDYNLMDNTDNNTRLYYGIHDNSKFIYSNLLSNKIDIKLDKDFKIGGIFELVIFTKSDENKVIFLIKNLFFVKPKETLKIDFEYNNNKNLINFDVKINNNFNKEDIFIHINVYEDNLLNYIEENKRESNLITKVFLTNESERDPISFNYSKFYNFSDNDCDKNLELYLGTIFKRLNKKKLLFYEENPIIYLILRLRGGGGPPKDSIDPSSISKLKSNSKNNLKKINIIENEKRISYQKGLKTNNDNFKDSFKIINTNLLYRVDITAVTKNGVYGFNSFNLFIKNDIDVIINYPNFVYLNNKFEIIISIRNNLENSIKVNLFNNLNSTIIESNSNEEIKYIMVINNHELINKKISEEIIINYNYNNSNKVYKENIFPYLIIRETKVNKNYLFSLSKKFNNYKINELINYNDSLSNLSNLKISVKKNQTDFILGIVKNLIKDPYGCFEQMASVTFPMAIAYNLLLNLEKNQLNEDLKNKIFEKLDNNLNKLLKYETSTGGFELFGDSPGSTTITAYGLLQFKFLNKIGFNLEELIDRSTKWLFDLYENGTFKLSKSLYSDFSNPPINIANTYILWVISEIYPEKIKKMDFEINNFNNGDSYILALIGLIYFNMGDIKNYEKICLELESRMINNYISGSKCSITFSLGNSLLVETSSLFILLELKNLNKNKINYVESAIKYLYSQYSKGYFVSTQGTILALLAINEYLKIIKLDNKEGIIKINVNKSSKEVDLMNLNPKHELILYNEKIQLLDNKQLEIKLSSKTENINVLIETNLNYYKNVTINELNMNNNYFKLDIIKIKEENNLSFFEIIYENLKDEKLGMANIEFKISNCYEINHNDLNNLKQLGNIAYYEISNFNDKIIFYFRSIWKKEKKKLKLSLYKKFNDIYKNDNSIQKDISCMYLFYGKDESIVYSQISSLENL